MRHAINLNKARSFPLAIPFLAALALVEPLAASQALAALPADDAALAMKTVAQAQTYSWGRVGTPARLSEAEVAARTLYLAASGAELVKGLGNASNEGKLYLLCVLARKDPVLFALARRDLPAMDTADASVLSGDVLQRIRMQVVLAQIQKHRCDPLGHR
jgi:hypothetical protein